MKYAIFTVALAGALVGGCGRRSGAEQYFISHEEGHGSSGSEDSRGEWFTREIDLRAGVRAMEVVYCPITAGQPQVCRTAVVWEMGETALIPGSESARDD